MLNILSLFLVRFYILKALGGLELLHSVFYAITINGTAYAISAWFGFLNKSHVLQINGLFKRAFKCEC